MIELIGNLILALFVGFWYAVIAVGLGIATVAVIGVPIALIVRAFRK